MTPQTPPQSEHSPVNPAPAPVFVRPSVFANWFWFILKNVLGWILILTAFVLGPLVPGPGGIPIFLIGFGLITFPGKRRITARVLSGKPTRAESRAFRRGVAIFALIVPAGVLAYFVFVKKDFLPPVTTHAWIFGIAYLLSAVMLWMAGLRSVRLVNWFLLLVPRIRRRVRPWLRRRGIDLLPPRRRRRRVTTGGPDTRAPDDEILSIHERHVDRMTWVWTRSKWFVGKFIGLAITAAIFIWILKPVFQNWSRVKDRMSWSRFALGAAMFALFLFAVRALSWRRILIGFGYKLPIAAATRIWSISELARYIPGMIWQVVGRMYLALPYGVPGRVTSTSQILELTIFLLANVLVAVSCLLWYGVRNMDGLAQAWVYAAMVLIPVLMLLLYPPVLYRLINTVMRRLGKPEILERMSFSTLLKLLLWAVVGLLWQSVALWLVTAQALELPPSKWWIVAGAYCLAWCAGFLAIWAPGGIGVRELVFVAAMQFALPERIRAEFASPLALSGFLAFLSVLLRLWSTAGELIVAGISYAADRSKSMPARAPASELAEAPSV